MLASALRLEIYKVSAIGLYANGTATDSYINREKESPAEIQRLRLRSLRLVCEPLKTEACKTQRLISTFFSAFV